MYIKYNANPDGRNTNDCTVRAISLVLGLSWEEAYMRLCVEGFGLHNMPDNNETWSSYLRRAGYKRYSLPNTCPDCYNVLDFCRDFPVGRYIVATGSHVIGVIDGDYYDTGDLDMSRLFTIGQKEKNDANV